MLHIICKLNKQPKKKLIRHVNPTTCRHLPPPAAHQRREAEVGRITINFFSNYSRFAKNTYICS